MINAVCSAQKLDWQGWLLGIFGSIIAGGAGAVGSGFGGIVVDPQHFNVLQGGFGHLLSLMAVTFIVSAIVSLCKFLQMHPVPQQWDGKDRRGTQAG